MGLVLVLTKMGLPLRVASEMVILVVGEVLAIMVVEVELAEEAAEVEGLVNV